MTQGTRHDEPRHEQLRPDGSLRHLLTLEGLPRALIERLLERAQALVRPLGARAAMSQVLAGSTVANLFTEPSTRTRVSFELAAKRLGAQVVNLEVQLSSRVKGESMLDTVYTLESLHVDAFVIRDAEVGVPGLVAAHVAPHVSVLSAGRSARRAPDAGAAGCADHLPAQAALRGARGGDRRRHPPLARRALGLARAAHARGVGPAHRGAGGAHARAPTSSPAATRHSDLAAGLDGVRRHHDAAHPEGAHGAGGPARRRRSTSAPGG